MYCLHFYSAVQFAKHAVHALYLGWIKFAESLSHGIKADTMVKEYLSSHCVDFEASNHFWLKNCKNCYLNECARCIESDIHNTSALGELFNLL